MQCTLDEQLGSRSKSTLGGLEVKPLKDGGSQSVVLTANAREVPLGKGRACDLIGATKLRLDPKGMVFPEGVCR